MPDTLRPAPTKLRGKSNWILVFDYEDINALTVAEVTAASSIDVTRVLFRSSAQPDQTTGTATDEPRFGDETTYESLGDDAVTGGDLIYAFGDQAAAGSDQKKLYEMIPAGATAALVDRRGVLRAQAPVAGQWYHAHPVEFSRSFPTRVGEGASAEAGMKCRYAITGESAINKQFVAA